MTPRLRRMATAVAAVLLLSSCPVPLRASVGKGDDLFARGDFAAARGAYRSALDSDPLDVRAHAGLIRSLLRLDRWEEAVSAVDAAYGTHPDEPDLLGLGALVHVRAGRIDRAQDSAKRARIADTERKSFWAQVANGEVAIWEAKRRTSLAAFERAVALRPDLPEGWAGLVRLTEAGSAREAEAERRYLALRPSGYPHERSIESLRETISARTVERRHFRTGDAPLLSGSEEVTKVPFSFTRALPVIEARLNGSPVRLVLDTGGSGVLLSPSAATRIGLKAVGETRVLGIQGKGHARVTRADSLEIGAVRFGPVRVRVPDAKGFAPGVDGNVGGALLSEFVVTVDLQAKQLTLRHQGKPSKTPPAAPQPSPSERREAGKVTLSIPFYNRGGNILFPVTAGNVTGLAILDTGANVEVVSTAWARRLSAGLAPEDVQTQSMDEPMGFGSETSSHRLLLFRREFDLQFGYSAAPDGTCARFSHGIGLSSLSRTVSAPVGYEVSALLGMGFLTAFQQVTIDYPARRLILVAGRQRAVPPVAGMEPFVPTIEWKVERSEDGIGLSGTAAP